MIGIDFVPEKTDLRTRGSIIISFADEGKTFRIQTIGVVSADVDVPSSSVEKFEPTSIEVIRKVFEAEILELSSSGR